MTQRAFSYELERRYYGRNWPKEAKAFRHLEPYLRCWMDPDGLFDGKRVLDVGAGESVYTRLIAERFSPRQIVACDLFLERLRMASRANRNCRLSFAVGDLRRLPFQTGSLDVVWGTLILHQIPDLREVVSEIGRVLTGHGCYAGIEPNPFHPVHLYRHLFGRRSPNQYLLSERHLAVFRDAGFDLSVRYFYARLPWARGRFLGTCMGILAKRSDG